MNRIEQMQEAAEKYSGINENYSQENLALTNAFAAGWQEADKSRWISVDDEQPPRSEWSFIFSKTVLVCDKDGHIDTAWYNFKLNRWEWLNDITHWMPLPEPPKKD